MRAGGAEHAALRVSRSLVLQTFRGHSVFQLRCQLIASWLFVMRPPLLSLEPLFGVTSFLLQPSRGSCIAARHMLKFNAAGRVPRVGRSGIAVRLAFLLTCSTLANVFYKLRRLAVWVQGRRGNRLIQSNF